MKNNHLLIVDPQNDFCSPEGSLFIPGADNDMRGLVEFLKNNTGQLNKGITVTKDWHKPESIDKASWFVNEFGDPAKPFTRLSIVNYLGDPLILDASNRQYTTANPEVYERTLTYLRNLKNEHTLWPSHCVEGTWGAEISKDVHGVLDMYYRYNLIHKGNNALTEHHSAIKAAVIDENDPNTKVNMDLINDLSSEYIKNILVVGEAGNVCVAMTVIDLIENSPYPYNLGKKIVLLKDFMSDAPGFDEETKFFNEKMRKLGVRQIHMGNHDWNLKDLNFSVDKGCSFVL